MSEIALQKPGNGSHNLSIHLKARGLLDSESASNTDCASQLALELEHMEEESEEVEGEGRVGTASTDRWRCMDGWMMLGMGGEDVQSGGVGRL